MMVGLWGGCKTASCERGMGSGCIYSSSTSYIYVCVCACVLLDIPFDFFFSIPVLIYLPPDLWRSITLLPLRFLPVHFSSLAISSCFLYVGCFYWVCLWLLLRHWMSRFCVLLGRTGGVKTFGL